MTHWALILKLEETLASLYKTFFKNQLFHFGYTVDQNEWGHLRPIESFAYSLWLCVAALTQITKQKLKSFKWLIICLDSF